MLKARPQLIGRTTSFPERSANRSIPRWVFRGFEIVAPYLIIAALLAAWYLATRARLVIPFLLPKPFSVVQWMVNDVTSGAFLINIGYTLYRTFAGFALATLIGVSLGILMSRMGAMRWFFDPIMSIGLPLPQIALLPVFMLWFGLGDGSKILMVAFSVVFQIVISTWNATLGVDKELLWSARSSGAKDRELLWEIILPAAMPQIFTGLQIAVPVCLIVVLITEMQMGGRGLGDAMLESARYAKTAGVFSGIIEMGITGFAIIKAMEFLRRGLLVWHQETMRDQSLH